MAEITLTTSRLLLRPFRADDFTAVHAYGSDPEVCRYTSFGPNTEADTRGFLERAMARAQEEGQTGFDWAVTLRGTGQLIGGCHLYLHGGATYKGELGYVYHPDFWGQGYATEAARAMTDFGFRELGLHRIYADFFAPNVASGRVMEKLGMQFEGRLREAVCKNDQWYDLLLYAILEDEWSGGDHAHPRP